MADAPSNYYSSNLYIGSYYFRVKVGAIADAFDGFIRISPIKARTEVVDFKHGRDKNVRRVAGRTIYEHITLERVYQGTDEFRLWREEVEGGTINRRDVTIEYCSPDGVAVRTLLLGQAFPVEWEMPPMDAGASQPAIEKITLAVENVSMVDGTKYAIESESKTGILGS